MPISADFEILSIAEDGGHSERMSSTITRKMTVDFKESMTNRLAHNYNSMKLSVTSESDLILSVPAPYGQNQYQIHKVDIDALIEWLIETKRFIEESDVVKKLTGVY